MGVRQEGGTAALAAGPTRWPRGRRLRPRSGLDGAYPRRRAAGGQRWPPRISAPVVPVFAGRRATALRVSPRSRRSRHRRLRRRVPRRPDRAAVVVRVSVLSPPSPRAAPDRTEGAAGRPPLPSRERLGPPPCCRSAEVAARGGLGGGGVELVATQVDVADVQSDRHGDVAALVDDGHLHRRARRQELDLLVLEHGVSSGSVLTWECARKEGPQRSLPDPLAGPVDADSGRGPDSTAHTLAAGRPVGNGGHHVFRPRSFPYLPAGGPLPSASHHAAGGRATDVCAAACRDDPTGPPSW